MLLAVLDARRPTADADLLARRLPNDEAAVIACVRDVAQTITHDEDGAEFLIDTISAESIRDGDLYAGTRITMTSRVSTATVKLKLDINFGDPVTPGAQRISFPSQRPGRAATALFGYPIETVLAEKISTAVSLGEANTRVQTMPTSTRSLDAMNSRTPRFAPRSMRPPATATCGWFRCPMPSVSSLPPGRAHTARFVGDSGPTGSIYQPSSVRSSLRSRRSSTPW